MLRVAPGQLCPPTGLGEGSGALPSPWQLPTSWPAHPGCPTCGRVLEVHDVGSIARPQPESTWRSASSTVNGTGQVLPRGCFFGGSDTVCAAPGMAGSSSPGCIPTGEHIGQCQPQHDVLSGQCPRPVRMGRPDAGGREGWEGQKQAGEGQLPSSPSWVPTRREPARNTSVPELTPDISKLSCFQKKL